MDKTYQTTCEYTVTLSMVVTCLKFQLRQEYHEFDTSLDYIANFSSQKYKFKTNYWRDHYLYEDFY